MKNNNKRGNIDIPIVINNLFMKRYLIIITAVVIFSFILFSGAEATRELEELPDLDVTFIARTPRYEKYHLVQADNGQWRLKSGTEHWQRWPESEEMITFTAQITNQGEATSGSFGFSWYVDGIEVASGTNPNINPGSYTNQEYRWRWQDGRHTIKFKVDPDNEVEEITKNNNLIEDKTNALSLTFHVEEGFCRSFDQRINSLGSYSCEDWLQLQIDTLNQTLADSTYPTAPDGADVRVRIDNIYIHANGEINSLTGTEDWGYDGFWNIAWDYQNNDCVDRGIWCADNDYVEMYAKITDWNLLRNLALNVLGLVDLSRLSVYTSDVHITGPTVNTIAGTDSLPEVASGYVYKNEHLGLLNSSDQHYFSEYSVLALNRLADYYLDDQSQQRGLPKRRGEQGDFLKDIPDTNQIIVLDKNGDPLPNVGIAIWQESAYGFEDKIKYSGGTDSTGLWTWPDKTATTYWGIRLDTTNPFAYAHLNNHSVGIGSGYSTYTQPSFNLYDSGLLIRLSAQGKYEYHWLDITDFNLAFWQGNFSEATYTIQTSFSPFIIEDYLITGTKEGGGPQIRVFNQFGHLKRQFMAFEENFRGGINVAQADVNGDGQIEIIVASGPGRLGEIRIFNSRGIYLDRIIAFDSEFRGGVSLAAGDLDGGGLAEIVVAPLSGGGPNVRIFGYRQGQYLPTTENFMAYDANFRGGVNVAVGDLEGNGKAEIITAPRSNGGPHLRIFGYRNGVYRPVILGLMAYQPNFHGGINLACGDLNGDGADEIVTGIVKDGGPHIRVFGRNRQQTISLINPGFMAFDPDFRGGVNVTAADLDNDGRAEIITGVGGQDLPVIRVYNRQGTLLINEFLAYPDSYQSGLTLSSGSI